jgi:hypothetical protein
MWLAWERRGECTRFLMGKPEGLGRPRRRWEGWIRMDLSEIGWWYRVYPVGSGKGPMAVSCIYGSGATE